jgi:hypothetical protein
MVAAAWSVPVITLAIATPAAAASVNANLTFVFTDPLSTRPPGSSLADATVTVTTQNGTPDAGEPVTITVLSGPASFPGNQAQASFVTGPGGSVVATGLLAGPGTGVVVLQAVVAGLAPRDITVTVAAPVLAATTAPPPVLSGQTFSDLVATLTSGGIAVSNAPVTFTVTGGSAHFAGNASSVVVTTTSAGTASAAGLVATGTGPIQVTASTPGAADVQFTLNATAPTATLVFDDFIGYDQFTSMVLQAMLENMWNSAQPAMGTKIAFTVPNGVFDGTAPAISGAGWTITGFVRGATTTVVTASYSGAMPPIGVSSTVLLTFQYPAPRPRGSHSFTAVASGGNVAPVTANTSFSVI